MPAFTGGRLAGVDAAATLTWDQVFAWRMRRQFLDRPIDAPVVDVVRRLAGVQAQVASSAELAVALRRSTGTTDTAGAVGTVRDALDDRSVVKTWAMRGTLHVLPADTAGAFLSLMAAGRPWERPSWVKAFGVDPSEMEKLAGVVAGELDGEPLTRDELIDRLAADLHNPALVDGLRSGWGTVLKPLAWKGVLCHGPSRGNRVTFTRPDRWLPSWAGVPDPIDAAGTVIIAYLGAHGPASPTSFGNWLSRGMSKKLLKEWFAATQGDLVAVDVEGESLLARAEDVDDLAATKPSSDVRLVGGFDHYVLGPQTDDPHLIPHGRRGDVSRAAGWISPVVIWRGRVAGVWEVADGRVEVTLFDEAGRVPAKALGTAVARVQQLIGA